jgi:hypothetical protein
LAASINGNAVVPKTSPVAMTSERRKNTRMSPSVCALGWCSSCTASPLNSMSFRAVKNTSVGHRAYGTAASAPVGALTRLSTFSWAMIDARPVGPVPRLPKAFSMRGCPARARASLPPM